MKSPLPSLFLFFLAGQFFSPFFDLMYSSTFCQDTLLVQNSLYHRKEKNSNSIRHPVYQKMPSGDFLTSWAGCWKSHYWLGRSPK
jgi:hypothetical protein